MWKLSPNIQKNFAVFEPNSHYKYAINLLQICGCHVMLNRLQHSERGDPTATRFGYDALELADDINLKDVEGFLDWSSK